jgi:hypothetical protein
MSEAMRVTVTEDHVVITGVVVSSSAIVREFE